MQKSYTNKPRYNQIRFQRIFKRKSFLSNELKKSVLNSIVEAKNYNTYVNLDLFLYGLLSEPNSLSNRLFRVAISQFQTNIEFTGPSIRNKVYERTLLNLKKKFDNNASQYSLNLVDENQQKPWLAPEVKDILKQAIISSLQTKKKIVVVTTKHIFIELLNKDYIRDFLQQLIY